MWVPALHPPQLSAVAGAAGAAGRAEGPGGSRCPGPGLEGPCSARGCHCVSGETGTGTLWVSRPYHIPPGNQSECPRQQKCVLQGGMRGGRARFLSSVPSESLTSIILTGLVLPHSPLGVEIQLFPIPYDLCTNSPALPFLTLLSRKSFLSSTLCLSSSPSPGPKSLPGPGPGTFWGADSCTRSIDSSDLILLALSDLLILWVLCLALPFDDPNKKTRSESVCSVL